MRSWWLLTPESLGFPLSSLSPDFICFWWTNLNSAISELLTGILPALCFCSIYCHLSPVTESLFLLRVFSLPSLTVSVTYMSSEDRYLRTQWRFKAMFPSLSTQVLCLIGTDRPPPGGVSSVASHPGFCLFLVAQMASFTSRSVYSKNEMYFCVF